MARHEAAQVLGREARHRGGRPDDRQAERVAGEELLGEEVVDEVFGVVVAALDLLQHDLPLALRLFGVEEGVSKHVREQVDGEGQVFGEGAGVIAGQLPVGEGVEVPPDVVHFVGDVLAAGPALGAFEEHVLQKVRQSGLRGSFVAASGGHPEAHGHGSDMGERLGHDPNPVVERRLLNVFSHTNSSVPRPGGRIAAWPTASSRFPRRSAASA